MQVGSNVSEVGSPALGAQGVHRTDDVPLLLG